MTDIEFPRGSVRAPNHLVASADHLATSAGVEMFHRGGNAVDAAIATNAVMAVVGPHLCGMGGDLFALVHVDGEVHALNSSGRAAAGSDAAQLRSEGHTVMPYRLDLRSVTVPGCVDGWVALHDRFGSLPLVTILEPARRLAADGFPASPLLTSAISFLDDASKSNLSELAEQATHTGSRVQRPGAARALVSVADHGREGFYGGEFGNGLLALGGGLFDDSDLATPSAEWVTPLSATAFGVELHTIPPNSQGYLALGSARLATAHGLPRAPHDEEWAHILIEASIAAGRDRPEVLSDTSDGNALLASIDERLGEIDPARASRTVAPATDGDTTYLCTLGTGPDGRRMGVSLIQSNAAGFGSHLVEPSTQINLHNRGMGFSLEPGHPAEFAPGRRPPHTLCPAIATDEDGLRGVFGTMGGDAQPQILLQVAARLFHHRQSPARAINAGRWRLAGEQTGFDTWTSGSTPMVVVEGQAPDDWIDALHGRGHRTAHAPAFDSGFGHAHAIVVDRDGMLAGAADPRTRVGSAAGG